VECQAVCQVLVVLQVVTLVQVLLMISIEKTNEVNTYNPNDVKNLIFVK